MQHPIDAASLGLFTNQPTIQASFERLESWVNKGLLRVWRPSSSGHAELYEFEHEAKREAGQRALRSSFSDAGAALDLQCYGLFLNFLGPPLKLTPLGPAYLFDALTLVEKVDRPRDESLLLRSLFQMAIMQPGATEMPSSSYLESGCPLNLIANLLNLLFITKTHTLELTDLLTRILLRDVERQTLTSNVVTVVGSAFGFAAEYFLTQKKSALSEEILKKLLGLFRTEPDEEHSFGEIVGSVMVKFMGHFAVTERNDQRLAELTDQFRAVYESSGRNGALAGFWALALRNLTTDATYKHDEDLTDRFLQELRNVSEHHPHSEIIALQLWSALGEASILYISKPDLFQALVKEQLQLRKKYPGLEERALKEVSRQQERFKRIVEDGEAKHGAERDDDT